jgi:hypothetical protein
LIARAHRRALLVGSPLPRRGIGSGWGLGPGWESATVSDRWISGQFSRPLQRSSLG